MKAIIFYIENEPKDFETNKCLLTENFDCQVLPENNNNFLKRFLKPLVDEYNRCKENNKKHEFIESQAFKDLETEILINKCTHILIDLNLDGETDKIGDVLKEQFDKNKLNVKIFTSVDHGDETITKTDIDEKQIENFKSGLNLEPKSKGTEKTGPNPVPETVEGIKAEYFEIREENDALKLKVEQYEAAEKIFDWKKNWPYILLYNLLSFIVIIALFTSKKLNLTVQDNTMTILFWTVFGVILVFLPIMIGRWKKPNTLDHDNKRFKSNINDVITLLFNICISASLLIAVIILLHELNKSGFDPLKISEILFLMFLPFFIICGFYFFYQRSFKPILFGGKQISESDFEQGSKLMDIIKTFFISSLVSYIIVKVIEIITYKNKEINKLINTIKYEKDATTKAKLDELISLLKENPITLELILYFFLLILLMVFYTKIKKH